MQITFYFPSMLRTHSTFTYIALHMLLMYQSVSNGGLSFQLFFFALPVNSSIRIQSFRINSSIPNTQISSNIISILHCYKRKNFFFFFKFRTFKWN